MHMIQVWLNLRWLPPVLPKEFHWASIYGLSRMDH